MKKKWIYLVIGLLILVIPVLLFSITILKFMWRTYDLTLEEETFEESNISISYPKQWGGYDAKEVYEKREGYESFIVVKCINFGGFPQIIIFSIDANQIHEGNDGLGSYIDWDIKRIEVEGKSESIIFYDPIVFLDGQILQYRYEWENQREYNPLICKDWVTQIDNTVYIVSICEREKGWERLDTIYSEIIESFAILE